MAVPMLCRGQAQNSEANSIAAMQLHHCNSDGWRRNTLAPTPCSDRGAWIYSVLSASPMSMRAGFLPLASWHLMNCSIYVLCFAVFLLSALGSLEGGGGPSSFFWLALGGGGLAASCARQCTEGLVWSAWSSAGRAPVPETPVS